MDAIKFLADCIRLEKKAQAEAEKEKQELQNKPASVEETAGAVDPKSNDKSSEELESTEPDKDNDNDNPKEPEEPNDKGE